MPEPIFYVRGFPSAVPFEGADPAMFTDLGRIAELSIGQVEKLSATLKTETGFLATSALRERVKTAVHDQATTDAVVRALNNLEPEDVERILKHVERVQKDDNKKPELDDGKMTSLRAVLPILIQHYPALARFEKARRLATLTGQRLDSADLICDLRPIFDQDGRTVEGMFPYTRLRLVATGSDGLPRDFEVEMSVQDVFKLFEDAKRAKQKLETLRRTVIEWLPEGLPDLPETRVPTGEGINA